MFILLLRVLIAVAFITLLERAYIGVSQRRRGPNKIFFWGLLQPVLDGLKLIVKSLDKSFYLNSLLFSMIPRINLLVFLLFWIGLPYIFKFFDFYLNSLFVVVLLGLLAFGLLLSGWASNRKYALYGRLRSIVQTLSYEICLSLILLIVLNLKDSFSFNVIRKGFLSLEFFYSLLIFIPVIIIILAECGRTPFDLLEAEGELVSGFNVEYGRVEFAFLFIAEYGIIITLSILFSMILLPQFITWVSIAVISIVLFTRYTLPRIRYDYLIRLIWKFLLPLTILLWVIRFNTKVT